MVYETDFYTVRRPRPTITSYSVTTPRQQPRWAVRRSVFLSELDRIYHKPRPQLGCMPLEDFLNSRPMCDFDDETRQIRAETDRLRRRIYSTVPRPSHVVPQHLLSYYVNPERVHHNMADDILCMSYYSEPTARTIGRGHLACVTFAGGKGYPRRRNHYSDETRDIGGEIKTRSYYNNNFNKSYLEAMSLPTGYASYLLRLKPPENNEKLTNLDKMHILALAEERKKNIKRNKTDSDLLNDSEPKAKLPTTYQDPPSTLKRQLSKAKEEEKELVQESQPVSTEKDDSVRRQSLKKQISVERAATIQPAEEVAEIPVIEPTEPPKPEKKVKAKKGSFSRTSSVQEAPSSTPVEQSRKEPAETKVDNTPVASQPEIVPDEIEKAKPESKQAEEVVSEASIPNELPDESSTNVHPPETQEIVSAEPEPIPAEVISDAPAEPISEAPAEPIADVPVEPIQPEEEPQLKAEDDVILSEPAPAEESIDARLAEENPIAPSDADIIETDKVIDSGISSEINESPEENETIVNRESEHISSEIKAEDSVVNESEAENKGSEIASSGVDNVQEIESSTEVQDIAPAAEVPEGQSTSEVQETISRSEITSEVGGITETRTETVTLVTTTTTMNMSENVIEEVISKSEDEAPKEEDNEPLIEEPQSPCDGTEIINNKLNSNEICEVLSDVPEE